MVHWLSKVQGQDITILGGLVLQNNFQALCQRMKIPVEDDDMEINSPSSVISSLCQDPEGNNLSIRDGVHVVREREIENQDEDEISGSFVIEIGASNCRDGSSEALVVGL